MQVLNKKVYKYFIFFMFNKSFHSIFCIGITWTVSGHLRSPFCLVKNITWAALINSQQRFSEIFRYLQGVFAKLVCPSSQRNNTVAVSVLAKLLTKRKRCHFDHYRLRMHEKRASPRHCSVLA